MFISWQKTLECVLIALFFASALTVIARKSFGIMQSGGYSCKKFMGWVRKKGNLAFTRLSLLALCCVLSCAVLALSFTFIGEYTSVIGLAAYIIFFALYIAADRKIALKVPVQNTPRLIRLYVVFALISAIFAYFFVTLLNFADAVWHNYMFTILRYCALAVIPLMLYPLLCLANLICKIYEIPHNKSFVKKAKRKLEGSNLKVIGITGSYGKTSVKQILSHILSKKYRVLSTARSHNTPLGIALTVNNANLEEYDLFIAEMGARHIGDIAELCEICPPEYAVITGICSQHLESFKTPEAIVEAKGEILAKSKKAFIAADCFELFDNYKVDKEKVDGIKAVTATPEGTSFQLTLGGKEISIKSPLLGKHSAENIALAATVAHSLGMTAAEIQEACKSLEFVEHRLQLIKSGDINILDDGYNSNVKGAKAAIEVLNLFGGRKICVTPGLVELGVLEESENFNLGKELAGLDLVILVGENLILPVKRGYVAAGGDEKKLKIVPTLNSAQLKLKEYLSAGDTVLFLNDLPDVY